MPTVIAPPPTRAFRLPAVLHDWKAVGGVLDDCQVHLVRLLQAAPPVAQPLRLIAAVAPDLPETGHAGSKIPWQQRDPSAPISRMGCCPHHCADPPQGVDQHMPFAPFDVLGPVKADMSRAKSRSKARAKAVGVGSSARLCQNSPLRGCPEALTASALIFLCLSGPLSGAIVSWTAAKPCLRHNTPSSAKSHHQPRHANDIAHPPAVVCSYRQT